MQDFTAHEIQMAATISQCIIDEFNRKNVPIVVGLTSMFTTLLTQYIVLGYTNEEFNHLLDDMKDNFASLKAQWDNENSTIWK